MDNTKIQSKSFSMTNIPYPESSLNCEWQNCNFKEKAKNYCLQQLHIPNSLLSASVFKCVKDDKSKEFSIMISFPIDFTFLALNPELNFWEKTYHGSNTKAIASIIRHGDFYQCPPVFLVNITIYVLNLFKVFSGQ